MANTGYIIYHQWDFNPRSPYYSTSRTSRVYDLSHCPSVSSQLYYSYYGGTTSYYLYSLPTLSMADFSGSNAVIISDLGGVVTTLPSSAFISASYLNAVSFPNCTHINASAFRDCYSLNSANFPNCSYISDYAFYATNVHPFPCPNVEFISKYAFYNVRALDYLSLSKCTYLSYEAFANCEFISYVNLPVCSYVGNGAFSNCTALTSISLPQCEYVGWSAFYSCTALTSISLPLCKYIYYCAFRGCTALTSVDLPLCEYIDSYAFQGCSALTTIYLGYSSVVNLSFKNAFEGTPIQSIYVPSSLLSAYDNSSTWNWATDYLVGF